MGCTPTCGCATFGEPWCAPCCAAVPGGGAPPDGHGLGPGAALLHAAASQAAALAVLLPPHPQVQRTPAVRSQGSVGAPSFASLAPGGGPWVASACQSFKRRMCHSTLFFVVF